MSRKEIMDAVENLITLAEEAYDSTGGEPSGLFDIGRLFSAGGVILMQAAENGMTKAETMEALMQMRMRMAVAGPPKQTNRIVVPGHGNSSKGERAERLVKRRGRRR